MRRGTVWMLGACAVVLAGCGNAGGEGGSPGVVKVVVQGYLEDPDRPALYGYTEEGAFVRRVSGPPGAGWGTRDMRWSPDRALLAFVEDKAGPDRHQAFVVDPDSGADPVALTTLPLTPGDVYVSILSWSPDGSHLLLYADLEADGEAGLYAVGLGGSPAVPLGDETKKEYYATWSWSPDGQYVTWTEGDAVNGPFRQMVASVDGLSLVDVSGSMVAGGSVRALQGSRPWAPDGSRLVFIADKEVDERFDLFSVLPTGAGLAKLSTDLAAGEDVWSYEWAPIGSLVAYNASGRLVTSPGAGGVPVPWDVGSESVTGYQWRPGTTELAWESWDPVGQVSRLRFKPAGGAVAVPLYTTPTQDVSIANDWRWSPDGSRIAFRAGDEDILEDHLGLFCVAVGAPGVVVDLLPTVTATGNVADFGFEWSPDGGRVIVRAHEDDASPQQVFVAAADGSATVQVSDVSAAQEGVSDIGFTHDGAATLWIEGWSAPTEAMVFAGPLGQAPVTGILAGPEIDWFIAR